MTQTHFVIVIDSQHDFLLADGALAVAGAEPLIEPMRDYLRALDCADTAGVLFTFDTHIPEVYAHSEEAKQFPIHCIKNTHGWENALSPDDVPADIPVWRLEKGVFDMWAEDDVQIENARDRSAPPQPRDRFFQQLQAAGITHICVIGVAADFCVKWAIEGLISRGFQVVVPAHLTKGIVRQIDRVLTEDFSSQPVRLAMPLAAQQTHP